MKVVHQGVEMVAMTPHPLFVVERAGRVCYKSEGKMDCTCEDPYDCIDCYDRAKTFVQGIIARGHESVIEHASATFHLVTDRGISHELVRHRLASFSQESTRYCNYGKMGGEITVVQPETLPGSDDEWLALCRHSEETYNRMIEIGSKPQDARAVLPTSLKTEVVMTANFREWRHVLKLRLAKAAHPQMRQLMQLVLFILMSNDEASPFFEDIQKAA